MKTPVLTLVSGALILAACAPSTTYIAQTEGEAAARARETPEQTVARQVEMFAAYAGKLNNPCMAYSGDKRDLCNFCTKMRQNGDLRDMVSINGQPASCGSVNTYEKLTEIVVPDNCADFNTQVAPIISKFDNLTQSIQDVDTTALQSVTDAQCKAWGVQELDNFVAFGVNVNDMIPWQKNTLERMIELCSENGESVKTVFTQLPQISKTEQEKIQDDWNTPITECSIAGGSCRLNLSDKIKKIGETCYSISPEAIKARQDAEIARIDREYGTLVRLQKFFCINEYPFATDKQCDCYARGMIDLTKEMIRKPAKNEIQAASQQASGERKVEAKCKLNKSKF